MKIGVIGSGYVGTTTAALLACSGHDVVAIDLNQERIDAINSGKAPFYEEGLDDLVQSAVSEKKLYSTSNYESLKDCDVVFSCVGTPDNPDGSPNLTYIHSAAKSAVEQMKNGAIFVQKSTVPPGTGQILTEKYSRFDNDLHYVSNPEFLREGTAIFDTLLFDRVVVGGNDKKSLDVVCSLYEDIQKHAKEIIKTASINAPEDFEEGKYIKTNLQSAELIKVTANAFLALKISYANSIAKLADKVDADIVEVMDGVGSDKRIGRAFLNAGRGYGGGCFPKDVSGLISSARSQNVDLHILTEAQELNSSMPGYIANKLKEELGGLRGKNIAVLGLAFKSGTSDARKSPAVKLANILDHEGANITAYDPKAMSEAEEDLRKNVCLTKSADEAIQNVDAVALATHWNEFDNVVKNLKDTVFMDCMNQYSKEDVAATVDYLGVGR